MKTRTMSLLAVCLIISATLLAQSTRVSGGISAGANYSYLNTDDDITGITYDWK
jgi:hypothetical protein